MTNFRQHIFNKFQFVLILVALLMWFSICTLTVMYWFIKTQVFIFFIFLVSFSFSILIPGLQSNHRMWWFGLEWVECSLFQVWTVTQYFNLLNIKEKNLHNKNSGLNNIHCYIWFLQHNTWKMMTFTD